MASEYTAAATFLQTWRKHALISIIIISLVLRHGHASITARNRHVHSSIETATRPSDPQETQQRPDDTIGNSDWTALGKHQELSPNNGGILRQEPRQSRCCYRQKKYSTIGFDTFARKPVRRDTGRCRRTHVNEHVTKKPTPGLQDYLRRPTRQEPTSQCHQPCDDGNTCVPTRVLVERSLYANAGDQLDFEIIDDCQCVSRSAACARVPMYKTFHHNTPYATTVDIGECRGRCAVGSDPTVQCRATTNKTETVIGPNGHECVDVITACACAGSCYRASDMIALYIIRYNETTGDPYETAQEIDVGKCVGGCYETKGVCIRNTNCEAVLHPSTHCSPKEYVPHTFLTRDYENLTVHVISDCRCY